MLTFDEKTNAFVGDDDDTDDKDLMITINAPGFVVTARAIKDNTGTIYSAISHVLASFHVDKAQAKNPYVLGFVTETSAFVSCKELTGKNVLIDEF
jgi:hypothetical protein